MTLILGIDDAGRGPLIGPMVLAGVLLTEEQETQLKERNIKDSKLLAHKTRLELAETIKVQSENFKVLETQAADIDFALNNHTNLNTLEALKMAKVINELNPKNQEVKTIIDCPSVNTEAFKATLISYIDHPQNLEILCEHKADFNHLSVGAASILAKVQRENSIDALKKEHGDFGSGYPSDPTTKEFLKSRGKELSDSGLFRKTWSTWKKQFPDASQGTLDGF